MAKITPCRHCGAPVSPDATTCPKCGVESPGQTTWLRVLAAVSAPGFLATAAVLYLIARCSADPPQPTAAERAAREQARAAADATCRTSATCWGERHMFEASVACRQLAARHGKHAVRWPDVGLIATFAPMEWAAGQNTIFYIGQAEFQNGFGAWTPYVVRCEVDIRTDDALQVNLTQGRL
jgi:hypothetical protein